MIGTIRKHSGVLWGIIITATVVSFIYWGAAPSRMGSGSGGGGGDYGSLYGKKVTPEEYANARSGFFLYYFFRSGGEWPDKNPQFTEADVERETYVRLMLLRKANDLGIHAGDDAVLSLANGLLNSLGHGHAVALNDFVQQILQPKGLTAQDFENFVRQYVVLEQLQEAMSYAGALVTPQEAVTAYERDNQEISAQAVCFAASNYLSSVTATPEAVARFYTNYLAEYRVPERVQVSYVVFEVSNYLAAAEKKLSGTNFNQQIDALYRQYGPSAFPDAKTPEEAKAQIRKDAIHREAFNEARQAANDFGNAVFDVSPVKPENLTAVARQKGLAVHVTAPFASEFGPDEFAAPAGFAKAAFDLTPDEPFGGPIAGPDAIYMIALAKRLPSEIPPLSRIRDRVAQDYQMREATLLARRAGTNFVRSVAVLTPERGFAVLCMAAGLRPQVLPPFSLSTQDMPELGAGATANELRQAAFTTPVGKASSFVETSEGGFILYVQSRLPVDQARMNSELPQFLNRLRQQRRAEAYSQWVSLEANRQLRTTPVYRLFNGGTP